MISTLQAELTNLDSIYTSYRPLILAATHLLKKEPSFNRVSASNRCMRRSLLPFLGDALSWLMGTATTKDINSFKKRVNQLLATQNNEQETLVHIICFKCHQICHSGEQATHQHNNGHSRQDTPGHHNILQHHKFTV